MRRLETCAPELQHLFREAIKRVDCTILEGARSDERQRELYRQGRSKLDGVTRRSRHQPAAGGLSMAVDVAPYPIDWRVQDDNVRARWIAFARLVFSVADEMSISLRWGMDWNRNWDWRDLASDPSDDPRQTFNDYPHWEIVP
jgi:peptidoglycan L-alanyl-D-glutamate endopeptidase CwlK